MKINVKWEGDAQSAEKRSVLTNRSGRYSSESSDSSLSNPIFLSLDSLKGLSQHGDTGEPEEGFRKFKLLQRAALVVPLEACVDQFAILKNVVNEPADASWMKLFKYKTPEERMTMTDQGRQKFVEEEYEKIPYTYRHKLKKDVCFLYATLMETCSELVDSGTFRTLNGVIHGVQRQIEDDRHIQAHEHKLVEQLGHVNRETLAEQLRHESALDAAAKVVGDLKDLYEDIIGHSNCEIRYTKAWETARRAQLDLSLGNKEGVFADTIDTNRWRIECEQRVHSEIENYINENIDDYQGEIQTWMQRYDEEIELRDAEILDLKMKWEGLTERHKLLAETYRQRAQEMEEYLEVKERRRLEEELERLTNWAVVKIQAWWRGTMVRKKLGPFRKKKKGKKDKKGGKKK